MSFNLLIVQTTFNTKTKNLHTVPSLCIHTKMHSLLTLTQRYEHRWREGTSVGVIDLIGCEYCCITSK